MPAIGFYMTCHFIGVGHGEADGAKFAPLTTSLKILLSRAKVEGFGFRISLGEGDHIDFGFVEKVIAAFGRHDTTTISDLVTSDAWWTWPQAWGAGFQPKWWQVPEELVVSVATYFVLCH